MDLRLDSEQDSIVDAVAALLRRGGRPPERARQVSGRLDAEALRRLDDAGFLDVADDGSPRGHLTALLITEQAAGTWCPRRSERGPWSRRTPGCPIRRARSAWPSASAR